MPDSRNSYFSYIRVSTTRQGQTGTSLAEQREAIHRYADRNGLLIIREFEEQETAAKRGRPVFATMLKALQSKQACGVIIHKIDRSARNLKDWADLGELIDCGVEVHFANESLDLQSRGGRLSADIQAVVAADYIRNLREETKKGFYGRIKQGLYPMPARIGYVDQGKGLPKAQDPIQASLVREAFELYASGKWGLNALVDEMCARGLRNKHGKRVTRNGLATMLHNPFYAGLIHLQTTGEMFPGRHEPLIPQELFQRVQGVLAGKTADKRHHHSFLFRKHVTCAFCRRTLIPEIHKGHVYYRCQTKWCTQKSVREEIIEESFTETLKRFRFSDDEMNYCHSYLEQSIEDHHDRIEEHRRSVDLQHRQIRDRLSRLTDAYLEGTVEKELYVEKKNNLLMEEQACRDRLSNIERDQSFILKRVEGILEQANSAYSSYKEGLFEDRRDLVQTTTSNFIVEHKTVSIKLYFPFQLIAERQEQPTGSPYRDLARTLSALLSHLVDYFRKNEFVAPNKALGQAITSEKHLPFAA